MRTPNCVLSKCKGKDITTSTVRAAYKSLKDDPGTLGDFTPLAIAGGIGLIGSVLGLIFSKQKDNNKGLIASAISTVGFAAVTFFGQFFNLKKAADAPTKENFIDQLENLHLSSGNMTAERNALLEMYSETSAEEVVKWLDEFINDEKLTLFDSDSFYYPFHMTNALSILGEINHEKATEKLTAIFDSTKALPHYRAIAFNSLLKRVDDISKFTDLLKDKSKVNDSDETWDKFKENAPNQTKHKNGSNYLRGQIAQGLCQNGKVEAAEALATILLDEGDNIEVRKTIGKGIIDRRFLLQGNVQDAIVSLVSNKDSNAEVREVVLSTLESTPFNPVVDTPILGPLIGKLFNCEEYDLAETLLKKINVSEQDMLQFQQAKAGMQMQLKMLEVKQTTNELIKKYEATQDKTEQNNIAKEMVRLFNEESPYYGIIDFIADRAREEEDVYRKCFLIQQLGETGSIYCTLHISNILESSNQADSMLLDAEKQELKEFGLAQIKKLIAKDKENNLGLLNTYEISESDFIDENGLFVNEECKALLEFYDLALRYTTIPDETGDPSVDLRREEILDGIRLSSKDLESKFSNIFEDQLKSFLEGIGIEIEEEPESNGSNQGPTEGESLEALDTEGTQGDDFGEPSPGLSEGGEQPPESDENWGLLDDKPWED